MVVRFLAALLAAVVLTPVSAGAQPAVPAAASPASASASAPTLRYRSSFDGQARTEDPKAVPWREANRLVGRIGGWKAYAREAQGSSAADAPPSPGAAPGPGSAPSAPADNSHQRHHP
jgi:hypothetical protein